MSLPVTLGLPLNGISGMPVGLLSFVSLGGTAHDKHFYAAISLKPRWFLDKCFHMRDAHLFPDTSSSLARQRRACPLIPKLIQNTATQYSLLTFCVDGREGEKLKGTFLQALYFPWASTYSNFSFPSDQFAPLPRLPAHLCFPSALKPAA